MAKQARRFIYNSMEAPDWLLINKITKPMFAPVTPNTLDMPGRPGVYYFGAEQGPKEFEIAVTIMALSENDLALKVEWLAGWLDQRIERPLEFTDEPDRYYNAVFTPGAGAMEQLADMGEGVLTFLVPDGLKRGQHYNYDLGDGTAPVTLVNRGNAKMYPTYIITFTEQQNFVAIASPDGIIQYGNPATFEEKPVPPLERILVDGGDDLAPWTASGVNVDFGKAAGSMRVDNGHRFKVNDYADDETNAKDWHGPVLKRSLPVPVKDFRLTAMLELYSNAKGTCRIEVYALNAAGTIMGRMILWDKYLSADVTAGVITSGANTNQTAIIDSEGPKKSSWNSFTGRLVLRREGKDWRASISKTDAKGRDIASTTVYNNIQHTGNQDDIAQLQIAIKKYGATPAVPSSILDIVLERINQVKPANKEAPALFQKGDRLEIDTETGDAWLNGEYFNEHLDPGSRFFGLSPGLTDVRATATADYGIQITVDYDEMYK